MEPNTIFLKSDDYLMAFAFVNSGFLGWIEDGFYARMNVTSSSDSAEQIYKLNRKHLSEYSNLTLIETSPAIATELLRQFAKTTIPVPRNDNRFFFIYYHSPLDHRNIENHSQSSPEELKTYSWHKDDLLREDSENRIV